MPKSVHLLSLFHGRQFNSQKMWLNIVLSFIFLALAFVNYQSRQSLSLLSILFVINVIFLLSFSLLLMNKKSPYALRLELSDEGIFLKTDLFRKGHFFSWEKIDYIELEGNSLNLHTATKSHSFRLKTNLSGQKRIYEDLHKLGKEKQLSIFLK